MLTVLRITATTPINCAPGLSSYPPNIKKNIPRNIARTDSNTFIFFTGLILS